MSDTVGIGLDGWLFLVGGSNDALRFFTDETYFGADSVAGWADLLIQRSTKCEALGARYLHVGAPEKLSVYNRFWPDLLDFYDRRPLNAVGNELSRRGMPEIFLDPTDHLKSVIDKIVYYKTDTHWNVYGATEVFNLICSKLGVPSDLIARPGEVSGWDNQLDLGSKISPPVVEFQTYIHPTDKVQKIYENNIVYLRENAHKLNIPSPMHHGAQVILKNINAKCYEKKIVIFGDSFFDYHPSTVTWVLAETFSEVHFLWSDNIDYDYIAAVKPDVVISEMAERFMRLLPADTSFFEMTQRERIRNFYAERAPDLTNIKEPTKGKKIFDCFTFFNELDILEIRFAEMYHHVDMFVICEARQTFQGAEKPLHFMENRQRFSKYDDKIKVIIIDKFPDVNSAWDREHYQRQMLSEVYAHALENDMIIITDVDEIISVDTLTFLREHDGYYQLSMPMYQYYINLLADPDGWTKPFAFSKRLSERVGDFNRVRVDPDGKLNELGDEGHRIEKSGWHFTYLGGPQKIVEKLNAYSHTEEWATSMREEAKQLHRQITIGYAVGNFWHLARYVPIDKTFPNVVLGNISGLERAGYIRNIYVALQELQEEARMLDHSEKAVSGELKKLTDIHSKLVSYYAPLAEATQLA